MTKDPFLTDMQLVKVWDLSSSCLGCFCAFCAAFLNECPCTKRTEQSLFFAGDDKNLHKQPLAMSDSSIPSVNSGKFGAVWRGDSKDHCIPCIS